MTVACTLNCLANRFSSVQITVQYYCIFVLLFGQYLLQLDNKLNIKLSLLEPVVQSKTCT